MNIKGKAELAKLPVFMDFIRQVALDHEFSPGVVQKVELALEEALVNIINYAYKETQGDIEIECHVVGDQLTVIVMDWGVPFDVLAKDDPDTSLSIDQRDIGGLGIFLVKQMMDEVTYQRQGDRNVLKLVKNNE